MSAVTAEAQTLATRVHRPQSQTAIIMRQFRRSPTGIIGGIIILLEIVIALAAPAVAPHEPLKQNFRAAMQPPSSQHWFGTDDVGRDILSRVIYGARISLRVGLISVAIGGGAGVLLGIMAGFYGRWLDNIIMRLIDVLLAFPGLLLALAIVAVLGPGLFNVMIAVGIGSIPTYTRMARATTLSIRERDYVLAARSVGCSNRRLMLRYILPNAIPPIIVLATLGVAGAILTAAGLSFIGVGAQPPTPEWGAMLTSARQYIQQAWWFTTFPGLAIVVTVLAINMVGDALRDALDPRLRR
jgi:peptide/nickel transport system permease protein